ncbi:AMP-binding enzyme family protein [Acinetobacter baumannii 44839_8]|nr:AMP-binding enzyme family protein [Acinetobacter baumannii 44839_8]
MKTLAEAYQQFDLTRLIEEQLVGHPQAINAYVECCERYVGKYKTALIWEGKNGQAEHYTFEQLAELSGKLANFFKAQGIQAGDCIAGLLPRTPELLITILATWRIGAIYQPLFTAFEAKSIDHRITTAQTKLIVTNDEQRPKLNTLNVPVIVTVHQTGLLSEHDFDFWQSLQRYSEQCEPVNRSFDDDFLMMFTSGTTGLAKSVPVPLKAILAFKGYMTHAVDLREEDMFWNLADPGWAYGLYYGITGPLSLGHGIIMDERSFNVDQAIELMALLHKPISKGLFHNIIFK